MIIDSFLYLVNLLERVNDDDIKRNEAKQSETKRNETNPKR
jgi:hypothetical protein